MANRTDEVKTKGNSTRTEDAPITEQADISGSTGVAQPRARGELRLFARSNGQRTVLERFHQSGSFKCLFPRARDASLDAVLLNTAGGITGGDRFAFAGRAGKNATITLTTQACERAYRAQPGATGEVSNRLRIERGARVNWLPQETILFNGSALSRRLNIDMAPDAHLLMVEPLIFGRPAMGEKLTDIRFRDRIEIRRNGTPLFLDAMTLTGDARAHLAMPFIANGAGAMALVVMVSDDAERHLEELREALPETGGATLIRKDVLVMRLLAEDGFGLRETLLPALRGLNGSDLPRCWMI